MRTSRSETYEFKKPDPGLNFLASTKHTYTYEELDRFLIFFKDLISEKSSSLRSPIAFLSESSDEFIFSIAACWKLGIPFIPLNPKLTSTKLEYQISLLKPSLILCDSKNSQRIKSDMSIIMDEHYLTDAFTFKKKGTKALSTTIDTNDIFGYFFTSGTSNTPKIVPLKRQQMYSAAKSSAVNLLPEPNQYWLHCLPLNHIGGISIILRSIIYGIGIYRLDEFDDKIVKNILSKNKKIQAISLVPTMLKRLLQNPYFRIHTHFKAVLIGGGPIDTKMLRKAVERGIPIISSYGMTETCAQIAANSLFKPSGTYTPLSSVGTLFSDNLVEIRDEKGRRQPVNESGLIWLKGPQIIDRYYENDHAEHFDENGWFNSGDFGHLNRNGHLFIENRRTDLIISGGENINPIEIEQALERLDGISEAAVIGIEDEEWGQKVVALITVTDSETHNLESVKNKLKGKIAAFKLPKELLIVEAIPKTSTGKIKKRDLKKSYLNS